MSRRSSESKRGRAVVTSAGGRRGTGATRGQRSLPRAGLVITLAILVAVAAGVFIARSNRPGTEQTMGGVTACKRVPAFVTRHGFASPAISTTDPRAFGLVLLDTADLTHRYVHPTWDDAGTLGPFVWDGAGNLYSAPVPRTNTTDNPPDLINTVYRVDAETGEMGPLLALPSPPGTGQANPYGIIGLAFDCDSGSLYASSVAGSSKDREIGHLYHIDPASAKVMAELKEVDAMGLGVFNGASGKRLYFGPAREPEIRSVALGANGDFEGEPRYEASLSGNNRARKITFVVAGDSHMMQVAAMPFAFSLRAASERQETQESFRYDPAKDVFEPMGTK